MYAEFSYDIVAGLEQNVSVLSEILKKFELTPNGDARLRCDVLSDTFICEIVSIADFNSLHQKLAMLRTSLGDQFNYAFSVHAPGEAMRIRGPHDEKLAKKIVVG